MDETLTLVIIVAVLLAGGALVWYLQQQRSRRLRDRFGPEYERTRQEVGDIKRAEAHLAAREQRVHKLQIRALDAAEATSFGEVWRHIQTLFVDNPQGAINEADRLVNDVMTAKGYPMSDFEQRAADISVDHATVVEHYRAAHAIADHNDANKASTEDLRQALIHYRALFDDLLVQKPSELKPVHAGR